MSIRATVIAVLLALIAALSFGVYYYHDAYSKADHDLSQAKETITDMQTRQRDVADLDAKYTGELADAKSKLDDLQRCVAAGKCGLRVNVVKQATATPGMDDATATRLTSDAERDYFLHRAGIETITKQLTGLQEYVRDQCLK
ncbi:endopeptidase [Pectobacterium brasiliense]|uniref:lysis protein n=1 Tax=Pectobacterium brasiliense TaxID=180957 RepID=UPI0001A42728|nr:lysis protein [Pectobacterium brasiliense]KGA24914.1 endopeptidase [Pectobacterium brasiliense]KRF62851.1 endopeptidase [Pectobacterium brasiliense]MBN3186060.1 lysis protein [Pectobacterium brasiliense]QHG26892.1 lysis protein [Pectobacterium brasiliense]